MEIELLDDRLHVGSASVPYCGVYMHEREFAFLSELWLERLGSLDDGGRVLLPFGVDDEYLDAFEARLHGGSLALFVVRMDGIGYVHGTDSFEEQVSTPAAVLERAETPLVTCDCAAFENAVRDFRASLRGA